jgi:hypothetical protein
MEPARVTNEENKAQQPADGSADPQTSPDGEAPGLLERFLNFIEGTVKSADDVLQNMYIRGSQYANTNPKLKYFEDNFPRKCDEISSKIGDRWSRLTSKSEAEPDKENEDPR